MTDPRLQRRAFGKRLADQGVVRQKLAVMIGAMEPCAHWLDSITHQMNRMPYEMQGLRLAGTTSLLKYQTTRTFDIPILLFHFDHGFLGSRPPHAVVQ